VSTSSWRVRGRALRRSGDGEPETLPPHLKPIVRATSMLSISLMKPTLLAGDDERHVEGVGRNRRTPRGSPCEIVVGAFTSAPEPKVLFTRSTPRRRQGADAARPAPDCSRCGRLECGTRVGNFCALPMRRRCVELPPISAFCHSAPCLISSWMLTPTRASVLCIELADVYRVLVAANSPAASTRSSPAATAGLLSSARPF